MPTNREIQMLRDARSAGITYRAELANFMAQICVESHNLTKLEESFLYTKSIDQIPSASALRKGPEALEFARQQALAGNAESLAELMYGERMGNTDPGDGYRYRGRGYIQLTGKENYRSAGAALDLELEGNPDLAALPENAARIAVWYWQKKVPTEEREDVLAATHRVNGGEVGLPQRYERNRFWNDTLTPEFLADLDAGRILPETKEARIVSSSKSTSNRYDLSPSAVRTLQESLNLLSYTDADGHALVVDGHYGKHTREAVAAFQRHQGLSEDSIAGPKTWAALQEATRVALAAPTMAPTAEIPAVTFPESAPPEQNMSPAPAAMMTPPKNPVTQPSPHTPSTAPLPSALSGEAAPPLLQGLPTIRDLQNQLTILGLTGPNGQPLSITGRLDPDTRYATQNFQAAFGLDVTGIPDRATMGAAREHAMSMAPQRRPQENTPRQVSAHQEGIEATRATETSPTAVRESTAIWTSEPLPPPRVPATFADPAHPQHYRYATLLDQVQDAPALQGYTTDQHARIASGLTFVSDQHRAFVIQDLRAIDLKGSTLVVTDYLRIGQPSEVLHGNLDVMLAKSPEETASAWREWALPKQPTLATHASTRVDPQPVSSTDLRHPQEPHHAMFLEARRKLGAAYAHHGMTRDPEQLDREAARVTVALRDRQFDQVPSLHLACEPDGRFSTQPGLCVIDEHFNLVKFSSEELKQAPPVAQSSQMLVQVEQRLQEQAIASQQWAQQVGLGRTP